MNHAHPKVSIVIPVYNGSNYLAAAIDSALNQTYSNIEVLVVNDGSNDGGLTRSIAESFGNRIRYFEKPNGGVSSALNRGIAEMNGDYFSWLSHDDLYEPDKLRTQVAKLQQLTDPTHTILYSDYSILFAHSGSVKKVSLASTDPASFRFRLAVMNDVHGCTLLIPRHAFFECGLFDETLRAAQDYDLWFRMSRCYTFVHIPEHLVVGRVHAQQVGVRLSGRVAAENAAFRAKSIEALSATDLYAATHRDPSGALLLIAQSLGGRGMYLLAWHCGGLSLANARSRGRSAVMTWAGTALIAMASCGCIVMVNQAKNLLRRISYRGTAQRARATEA